MDLATFVGSRKNPSERNAPENPLPIQVKVCPAEEKLELFALHRLLKDQERSVRLHLHACLACRDALREQREYILVVRAGLRGFEAVR